MNTYIKIKLKSAKNLVLQVHLFYTIWYLKVLQSWYMNLLILLCSNFAKRLWNADNFCLHDNFQVTLSMLEIYNEQVRDLLNPKSIAQKGGLKVRQHPSKGFYGMDCDSFKMCSCQLYWYSVFVILDCHIIPGVCMHII